jgi:hypothetical protein
MRYRRAVFILFEIILLTGCGVLNADSGSKSANSYVSSLVFDTEADLGGLVCDSAEPLFSSESAARDEVKDLFKVYGLTGKISLSFSRGSSALAYFDLWSSDIKLKRAPADRKR